MTVQPRLAAFVVLTTGLFATAVVIALPNHVYSQTAKTAPAKDRVKELEAKAKQCRTAEEAKLLYGLFMTSDETTDEEREKAKPQQVYWTEAAESNLVRVGLKWMGAREADALKAEADKLVVEAIEALNLDDFEGADKKLKKASNIYPEHLASLYLLGIGACLNGKFEAAEAQFTKCLARSLNNVAALNNTAVCEAKSQKYSEAIRHWEMAANIDPENVDVKYNVGNFVSAAAKHNIAKVDRGVIDRATSLFSSMAAKGKIDPAFVISVDNKPAPKTPTGQMTTKTTKTKTRTSARAAEGYVISKLNQNKDQSITEESQIIGNGSGFVIAPGYVLTNRHVVSDAQSLSIQPPGGGALLTAKVIAIGQQDLALLECKELTAPAVAFAPTAPGRGTDVMALGFPLASMVGTGLKTTRGIITGLPEKATSNMMLLDVPVNPGNSGGPLCDKSGRVVGVVTAKTFSDKFTQGYGLAIPIDEASAFIRGKLNDWQPTLAGDTTLDWPEVDKTVSKSAVMILIWKKTK